MNSYIRYLLNFISLIIVLLSGLLVFWPPASSHPRVVIFGVVILMAAWLLLRLYSKRNE